MLLGKSDAMVLIKLHWLYELNLLVVLLCQFIYNYSKSPHTHPDTFIEHDAHLFPLNEVLIVCICVPRSMVPIMTPGMTRCIPQIMTLESHRLFNLRWWLVDAQRCCQWSTTQEEADYTSPPTNIVVVVVAPGNHWWSQVQLLAAVV